ncbi:MAG: DeoR/GlpR transcriptional regulator, partial [Bifidobacterium sp.]|nr:DeoR/GlpR transcriptional regulator [Bifidobacterium sp.]
MCDNVHMISSQRQHLILSRLRTRGAVRITALSKELGVSAMTIRRDIADLADK